MQLTELYSSVLVDPAPRAPRMTITPPLAPGLWDAALTGLLASEGRTIKAVCAVPAGDGTHRPVLWTIDFDAELPSTAPAALAGLSSCRWLIGADGQIEKIAAAL